MISIIDYYFVITAVPRTVDDTYKFFTENIFNGCSFEIKMAPLFLKMVFRVTKARIPFGKRSFCLNADVQNIWMSSQLLNVTSLIVLA
jgi:hypothetical protein